LSNQAVDGQVACGGCRRTPRGVFCLAVLLLLSAGCKTSEESAAQTTNAAWVKSWRQANPVWRGIHIGLHTDKQVDALVDKLPKLASLGVNVLVVEVNYSYEFQSHPELRSGQFISRAEARRLADAARVQGIRLIPQLNCLGHQSWSKNIGQLLAVYPELDETPGQFPENQGIYCRSWCPQHPRVNGIIFALIDELAEGFQADAFHVGMDEVFLIASQHCPRCRGRDTAELFAKAVQDLHGHITGKRKLEMLMWGDRLLDAKALGYSKWEASANGTAAAADLVSKEIIVCDWHYGKQTNYPSVPALLNKGFKVWPSGWQPLEATQAFSAFARNQNNPRMMGYLCTTWSKAKIEDLDQWPPITQVLPAWR
jgi:hypothetical protein